MAYTYNPITNELIDDESALNNIGRRLIAGMSLYDDYQSSEPTTGSAPVRKPNAIPQFASGGLSRKTLLDMLKNEYPKEYERYKHLSEKELKKLFENLDNNKVPFRKGGPAKNKKNFKKENIKLASETPEEEKEMSDFMDMKYYEGLKEFLRRNPYKTEDDYKKEILKINLAGGGPVKQNLRERTLVDELNLSNAMSKISDAMSGISGVLARQKMADGGGGIKPKIKRPILPKKINLADYFKAGVAIADLSKQEREQVNLLLDKMMKGTQYNQ